jgi:Regulator of ribonuclease activity B
MSLLDRLRQKRPPAPELDLLVVRQLESAGADLGRPRHVVHYLYFEAEEGARRAAGEIEAAGYGVAVAAPEGDVEQWAVRAEATRVVDPTTVAAFRASFERIAAAGGGEYDGWEASAEP